MKLPYLKISILGLIPWLHTSTSIAHQTRTLELNHHQSIQLEVADTAAKRQQGLMFRQHLPSHHGMLFLFDKRYPWRIWMKNMNFPIDIIWLNEKKEVIDFLDAVPPCPLTESSCPSYAPKNSAINVIELQAGQRKILEIKLGQALKY